MKYLFLGLLSMTALGSDLIKLKVDTDFVSIQGIEMGGEYLIDTKAKLCFWRISSGPSVTPISCDELVKGYPEVLTKVKWKK